MATTPLQSWTVPTNADGPLGGTQMATLGAAAEKQAVMRFASAAARDAAIPAASREEGMVAWLKDADVLTVCDADGSGGVWRTFTQPAAWTSYTPAFSSQGTAPVMLSGNRVGRWRQVGGRVEVEAIFTWTALGGGEGLGTGSYLFGLPVAMSSWYPPGFPLGSATFNDAGVSTYPATPCVNSTTNIVIEVGSSAGKVSNTIPVVPSNSDRYSFKVGYDV